MFLFAIPINGSAEEQRHLILETDLSMAEWMCRIRHQCYDIITSLHDDDMDDSEVQDTLLFFYTKDGTQSIDLSQWQLDFNLYETREAAYEKMVRALKKTYLARENLH